VGWRKGENLEEEISMDVQNHVTGQYIQIFHRFPLATRLLCINQGVTEDRAQNGQGMRMLNIGVSFRRFYSDLLYFVPCKHAGFIHCFISKAPVTVVATISHKVTSLSMVL
jgi:hypothetical protein